MSHFIQNSFPSKISNTINLFLGFQYYIGPQTFCVELWRSGPYTSPTRTYCGKGQAFDLDICACNNWLFVVVEGSCRSGTGRDSVDNHWV